MQIVREFLVNNKSKLLIILGVIVLLTCVSIYFNKDKDIKNYISDSYVFTKEEYNHSKTFSSKLPYVNIKNKDVDKVNIELISEYYNVITLGDRFMDYEYYVSDNIISLVVETHFIISPDSYPSKILIYNFDIDDGTVLSDEELFYIFNVSDNDVSDSIKNELGKYYDYELSKGYVDESKCDFNCYLNGSITFPILNDCKYYVKNNYLYAYKNVSLNSKFFYDTSSGFDLFKFNIKKK